MNPRNQILLNEWLDTQHDNYVLNGAPAQAAVIRSVQSKLAGLNGVQASSHLTRLSTIDFLQPYTAVFVSSLDGSPTSKSYSTLSEALDHIRHTEMYVGDYYTANLYFQGNKIMTRKQIEKEIQYVAFASKAGVSS